MFGIFKPKPKSEQKEIHAVMDTYFKENSYHHILEGDSLVVRLVSKSNLAFEMKLRYSEQAFALSIYSYLPVLIKEEMKTALLEFMNAQNLIADVPVVYFPDSRHLVCRDVMLLDKSTFNKYTFEKIFYTSYRYACAWLAAIVEINEEQADQEVLKQIFIKQLES